MWALQSKVSQDNALLPKCAVWSKTLSCSGGNLYHTISLNIFMHIGLPGTVHSVYSLFSLSKRRSLISFQGFDSWKIQPLRHSKSLPHRVAAQTRSSSFLDWKHWALIALYVSKSKLRVMCEDKHVLIRSSMFCQGEVRACSIGVPRY